jgi:hypothetical protein
MARKLARLATPRVHTKMETTFSNTSNAYHKISPNCYKITKYAYSQHILSQSTKPEVTHTASTSSVSQGSAVDISSLDFSPAQLLSAHNDNPFTADIQTEISHILTVNWTLDSHLEQALMKNMSVKTTYKQHMPLAFLSRKMDIRKTSRKMQQKNCLQWKKTHCLSVR